VVRDVAGRKQLDHAAVSIAPRHYGNHAALASLIPQEFLDRGIPKHWQDKAFSTRVADYRSASQNSRKKLSAGECCPSNRQDAPLGKNRPRQRRRSFPFRRAESVPKDISRSRKTHRTTPAA